METMCVQEDCSDSAAFDLDVDLHPDPTPEIEADQESIVVRTMMAIGEWSSYSAIEPYLDEPTEGRIDSVMMSSG